MNTPVNHTVDENQNSNTNKINKAKKLKAHDIISALEDFRILSKTRGQKKFEDKSILISMKVPESLLNDFKKTCADNGLKYQTHIKELMRAWLKEK